MNLLIKHKLLLLAVLPCLVMLLVLLAIVNRQMNQVMEADSQVLREILLDAKKTELRHSLDIAQSLIQPFYTSSSPSSESKAAAIQLLQQLKYGKDGYYFGYDGNSVRIFSGSDTNNIGKSYADYKDVNGVLLINELVKRGREGGGFVTYHFPRITENNNVAYPKLSYAIWLEKWNLMIGTGFYIDDIDRNVEEARKVSEEHIRNIITMIFSVTLILFIGVIAVALVMAQKTVKPIHALVISLRDIASGGGDLTRRLQHAHKDELGEVTDAFNQFVGTIHQLVSNINQLTSSLTNVSRSVSSNTKTTFHILEKQREQTLQIASAINEMAASANEVARSTQESANAVSTAETVTQDAETTANKSIHAIRELTEEVKLDAEGLTQLQLDVDGIGAVLDVIRGIAEQTNLLALNASIEAARAGEQGRGFAVVADEVRGLAGRTQESTREIQAMIQRLQTSTHVTAESIRRSLIKGDASTEYVGATAGALSLIGAQVGRISQRSLQIATATDEQTRVIESINHNMHQIADATEAANTSAQKSQQMGLELDEIGKQLELLVKQFRV
ncbi:MAG: cache domain-containing protein [Cellvibrio sp.]|nr:cache domain-containing protein [Cellvibrio sp.]